MLYDYFDHSFSSSSKDLTKSLTAFICDKNGLIKCKGKALGPTQSAWSGSRRDSKNRPAIPVASFGRAAVSQQQINQIRYQPSNVSNTRYSHDSKYIKINTYFDKIVLKNCILKH